MSAKTPLRNESNAMRSLRAWLRQSFFWLCWLVLLGGPIGVAETASAATAATAHAHHQRYAKADKVVVSKSRRVLELWKDGEVLESFRVALGRMPRGHKIYEGDGRTPEGTYVLGDWNHDSRFYRSMMISYPSPADSARAASMGKPAGGQIMLHGLAPEIASWGSDHYLFNWTEGCIALTNEEIDIVWRRVRPGTPIEIMP